MFIGREPGAGLLTKVQVGAEPTDTELVITRSAAVTAVFTQALVTGRELVIEHSEDSAIVLEVELLLGATDGARLRLDAIEVTQAIQDLSQSVPLIAGKRTVVRVYLSNTRTTALRVQGRLRLRQAPNQAPVTISSVADALLEPAQAGDLAAQRNSIGRSLDFIIPATQTSEGPLSITLGRVTDVATGALLAVDRLRRPSVWFHRSPPLRVRVFGMRYVAGTPSAAHVPANLDFDLLFSWLRRAYPVGNIVSTTTFVNAAFTAPFNNNGQNPPTTADLANEQLAAIRTLDIDAGEDPRTRYYGLVSDAAGFMRGRASGMVACGPTGPAPRPDGTFAWDADGRYGDWYGGHELGHTYGRRHPGFCGESQSDIDNYPHANGALADSDVSFAGFDVGDPGLGLPMEVLPGLVWRDVMTYCNNQWISSYTFQGIRGRLLAEEPPAGAASSGTRGLGTSAACVSVVARINLTRGAGSIRYVHPVSRPPTIEHAKDDSVRLRVRTDDGTVVSEHSVSVNINSELDPGDDVTGVVDAVIPLPPDAASLELVISGDVADRYAPAPLGEPTVRVGLRRVAGTARELTIDAGEVPAPGLSHFVQVSTDDGRTWRTVAVGLKERGRIDLGHLGGDVDVRVRVVATNGFSRSVVATESFRT
jgi:hypothetical protein